MNWWLIAKTAQTKIIPFDPENDEDDSHPDLDRWDAAEQGDAVFKTVGVRPNQQSQLSHLAIEDGRVIGAVSSEWYENSNDSPDGRPVYVFAFDVAVLPQYRGPAMIGMKLIQQGINKYHFEKDMYEDNGGHTMMRLWVINPRLVPVLERQFGFQIESTHGDGSAHMIMY